MDVVFVSASPESQPRDELPDEWSSDPWILPMCFEIKHLLMVIRASGCNKTTCVVLQGDGSEPVPAPAVCCCN